MAKRDIIDRLRAEIGTLEQSHGAQPSAHCFDSTADSGDVPSPAPESALRADQRQPESARAFKKIVALVNASDKSELAIRTRLARDGFSESDIEDAVSKALEFGFIDDRRFSEVLIRSRLSQGRGSAGIKRELAENGIDAETVEGWPYDYPLSHDEELDRALGLLDRKPPHAKNMRDAAYRRLMQKGYPSSVASSAARIWAEQRL